MDEEGKYTCTKCGQLHDAWPALAFGSPTPYLVLPENLKQEIGQLNSDFCDVRHPDQTDRFIGATQSIKVVDHCENLEYGIWVSLSEKSYEDYAHNFGNHHHQPTYFGWLSNNIPEYDVPEGSIPTTVIARENGWRPEVIPHEDFDHPLVRDYYEGITKAEAEMRIHAMLKFVNEKERVSVPQKKWWKLWLMFLSAHQALDADSAQAFCAFMAGI